MEKKKPAEHYKQQPGGQTKIKIIYDERYKYKKDIMQKLYLQHNFKALARVLIPIDPGLGLKRQLVSRDR